MFFFPIVTVKIFFKTSKCVSAIERFESDDKAGSSVVVDQPFHEYLLIGAASSDLQTFQLKKLVENSPFQMVSTPLPMEERDRERELISLEEK